MAPLTFPVGTPADRYASNWTPTYRHRIWRAIKKRAGQVTRVIFGCSHRNVTPVTRGCQDCLDCTAWREVLPPTLTARAYTSRWRTREPREDSSPQFSSGRIAQALGFPATLCEFLDDPERERAWIKLMFAAKRHAESALFGSGDANPRCLRCSQIVSRDGRGHLNLCDAGAVLSALATLENLKRKEDAEEEVAPASGFAGGFTIGPKIHLSVAGSGWGMRGARE